MLARHYAELILRDKDGNERPDPANDQSIGGVFAGPTNAGIYDMRSFVQNGQPLLSQPVTDLLPKRGKSFGAAIVQVLF